MAYSLILLLKGPMQSWGDDSRFRVRETSVLPTKSGVLGLLASAQGRRRSDSIEDLVELKLAVRVDQPGTLLKDYQTSHPWQLRPNDDGRLITRYYLEDAAFLVALEAEDRALLESLEKALERPKYPLYLGRRSCPAPAQLVQGIVDKPAVEALQGVDKWFATTPHKRSRDLQVSLPIYRDATAGEVGDTKRDVPVSFDPKHRQYSWRKVVQLEEKIVDNPDGGNNDIFFEAVLSA